MAAALAVVVALGAVLLPTASNNKNSFTLTAYAAEATSDEPEPLDKFGFKDLGKMEQDSSSALIENDLPKYISSSFNAGFRCEGKGILSLTYKISSDTGNPLISLPESSKVIDSKGKTSKIGNEPEFVLSETSNGQKYLFYNEVTVPYDRQLEAGRITVWKRTTAQEAETAKAYITTDGNEHWVDKTDKADFEKICREYTEIFLKNLRLDVTAHFEDGSSQTKTVVFGSDCKIEKIKLKNQDTEKTGEAYDCTPTIKAKLL
jgi:hypothetical protein